MRDKIEVGMCIQEGDVWMSDINPNDVWKLETEHEAMTNDNIELKDMCSEKIGEIIKKEKQLVMAIDELKDIPYIPWLDNKLTKKIRKVISILKDNQEV